MSDSLRAQLRREAAKKAWETRRARAAAISSAAAERPAPSPAPAQASRDGARRQFATYPIPIRQAGGPIEIATLHLPEFMTEREAERIASIVRALAFTERQLVRAALDELMPESDDDDPGRYGGWA